ncbi:MAG TPA: HD domain-containing protein [Flavobacterium sp.]|uniref:HD domain-containing protein n=1 Tax=Flavobacterium sp. TaxID=239 RepID=UPI002DB9CA19|nr:HD domain-containing protein [Flavobacterium sp.]HEU4792000.1 HD domain-containing protein [Flavobacterium sp.]
MIKNYKYLSPFKILISFHKLIDGLEKIAASNIEHKSNYAKSLLSQINNKPEIINGIDNLELFENNHNLIQNLLADLFPTALTFNEIKAVAIPFYDITFNYSERFKKILNDAGMSFDISIRDMNEHQFYIMNCTFILNAYYKQNVDFEKPLFYDIPNKNGIVKHYKIVYNTDFLEIYPAENTKFLTQPEIEELIDNYHDIELWKKAFPYNSWFLKGFALITLVDVTLENAVSNLKTNLLKANIEKVELNDSFESIFRSVFKIPDLKVGFTLYDNEERLFMKPPFNEGNLESFILLDTKEADCKNVLCGCSFESLVENNKPFIIPNVLDFSMTNNPFAVHLLSQDIQSFLLAPVIKDHKLLGLIQLASSTIRTLNSVNANKLELLLPYISDTIEKSNDDMVNHLEAIIQKEYTLIHPSVYWKFKKEVRNYFHSNISIKEYTFKEIVFKEVYPLYGQIDIKDSSENRNRAIVNDLKEQINQIITIIKGLNFDKKIGVIEQKKHELQKFLLELDQPLKNNSEQKIHHYIETEIHSFLKNFEFNQKTENKIKDYFNKLDPKTEMFYQTRKDFDDTIMSINKKLSNILESKQQQAQEIFPHYYESFKTDGVEHNLYIGASIEPNKVFNPIYLQNLRLWQLETLCEMELEHHKLKTNLPYTLDVTSLILASSTPISIRFRMDEKRFDVDGSYNARYEVVKKRIDKAFVKNSEERITQKEKITIVYSNSAEEKEYIKYIKYLQHKNILEAEIEKLEVQDLQAISGLKALRVKVKHSDNSLLIEAKEFITKLFKERLDSKYSYHNLEHTKSVVMGTETICRAEKIDPEKTNLLLLAAWFHDAGYIEGADNHEKKSIKIALDFLQRKNISDNIQQKVSDLILATTFNYIPKNRLEKIIKDADNAHLANENYPDSLELLRGEWENSINKKYCNDDWYTINIEFLKKHQYFTKFAQKEWQNLKDKNLNLIENKLLKQ